MRRRQRERTIILTIICVVSAILLTAMTYLQVKLLELPISLPFMKQTVLQDAALSADVTEIIDDWSNVTTYEKKEVAIEEVEVVEEVEEVDYVANVNTAVVDEDSIKAYVETNEGLVDVNGNVFIDLVTADNQATGINSVNGDTVLAVDTADGITIVGKQVGSSNGKIAFVDTSKAGVNLNVVDDLNYWEEIATQSEKAGAILAINASDYTWNDNYNCGKIKGLVKRNGDTMRKTASSDLVVGINDNCELIIGDEAGTTSAVEGGKILIKGNEIVADTETDTTATARTVIGKTSNGNIVYMVCDGNETTGATLADLVDTLQNYGVTDAVLLASGNRCMMYFNGRVVTNLFPNSDEDGIKLPNLWIVKTDYKVESKDTDIADFVAPEEEVTTPDDERLNIGNSENESESNSLNINDAINEKLSNGENTGN